jgi:hypothetical protein
VAQRQLKTTKRANKAIQIVRRPSRSLKDDHHKGKIDILSIYRAIERLLIVDVVLSSFITWESEAA